MSSSTDPRVFRHQPAQGLPSYKRFELVRQFCPVIVSWPKARMLRSMKMAKVGAVQLVCTPTQIFPMAGSLVSTST